MITWFRVHNLRCTMCTARIEEELLRLPGVKLARIDPDARTLRLEGDLPLDDTALAGISSVADAIEPGASFELIPYTRPEAQDVFPRPGAQGAPATEGGDLQRGEMIRLAIAALLFACGMLFDERLKRGLPAGIPPFAVDIVLYGLPYLLCGTGVLLSGVRSVLRGDIFNEFTLMGTATLAAMGIGALPEAVGVMLFYSIGELLQERAAGQARTSIRALLAGKPDIAHVVEQEDMPPRDVHPEVVLPGARLLVRPGEKIPLDGVIVRGSSQLDTSPLTGESLPVRAGEGDAVYAGTINLDSMLTMRVTAAYEDSSVARVLDMVENAMANKAPTERFITRFARYWTPAVTLLAVLVAVLPPLAGFGSWQEWLYRALVLLVISCPCALVISIPLGYFGGIGAASRKGVLVKGGHVLDALNDIRTIAFDKTGTLTQGVFAVSRIDPIPGVTADALLRLAVQIESHSNHPVARSIVQAAAALPDQPQQVQHAEVREVPGQGVELRAGDRVLLAGSPALLAAHDIVAPTVSGVGAVVHIAENGRHLGVIIVADSPRPEAFAALAALRAQGFSLAMLTGDRPENALPVAEELYIDQVRAGLLPGDKVDALASFGPVSQIMFVGDGINDAPVLATAGIGVAMGGLGAQAAVEAADAVILDDAPGRVVDLLRIGRRTRTIVYQNIVLALSIKGVFMALGVVGISGLWEAVFADVGVALLAVLNAMRVGKEGK